MKQPLSGLFLKILAAESAFFSIILFNPADSSADQKWYVGDEKCPPPLISSNKYSPPYNPLDYPFEYPTFEGADKPGWSCSYQREDGIIVQFGDSRTPQQKWLDFYSRDNDLNR